MTERQTGVLRWRFQVHLPGLTQSHFFNIKFERFDCGTLNVTFLEDPVLNNLDRSELDEMEVLQLEFRQLDHV